MRAAIKTVDDGYRARLLRTAVHAITAEVELLQTCGLLRRDLGTLTVAQPDLGERIPSGVELQTLFDSIVVTDGDLMSDAEKAYNAGDWAGAFEAEQKDKAH